LVGCRRKLRSFVCSVGGSGGESGMLIMLGAGERGSIGERGLDAKGGLFALVGIGVNRRLRWRAYSPISRGPLVRRLGIVTVEWRARC
jgi:hypothetical protein